MLLPAAAFHGRCWRVIACDRRLRRRSELRGIFSKILRRLDLRHLTRSAAMYVPHAFHTDRTASLAFAADRGFGLVVACDGLRPVSSPLPFRLGHADDGGARVSFHVARANGLADLAANCGGWPVGVPGAGAY